MNHRYLVVVLGLLIPAETLAKQTQTEPEPPTISVDATAEIEREPERAIVMLAVETEGASAQAASQANATAMDAVLRAIRGQGVPAERIRTTSFRLDPVYGRRTRPDSAPMIVGYRAINMVQVTVDTITRVGAAIDAGIGAGANRVAGLNFELRDPDEARLAALGEAVAKARREAEAVARAAGQRLGDPLRINMSSAMPMPRPFYDARVQMEAAQMAPTPIEGGTLTVTATVHIVYRLERM